MAASAECRPRLRSPKGHTSVVHSCRPHRTMAASAECRPRLRPRRRAGAVAEDRGSVRLPDRQLRLRGVRSFLAHPRRPRPQPARQKWQSGRTGMPEKALRLPFSCRKLYQDLQEIQCKPALSAGTAASGHSQVICLPLREQVAKLLPVESLWVIDHCLACRLGVAIT